MSSLASVAVQRQRFDHAQRGYGSHIQVASLWLHRRLQALSTGDGPSTLNDPPRPGISCADLSQLEIRFRHSGNLILTLLMRGCFEPCEFRNPVETWAGEAAAGAFRETGSARSSSLTLGGKARPMACLSVAHVQPQRTDRQNAQTQYNCWNVDNSIWHIMLSGIISLRSIPDKVQPNKSAISNNNMENRCYNIQCY